MCQGCNHSETTSDATSTPIVTKTIVDKVTEGIKNLAVNVGAVDKDVSSKGLEEQIKEAMDTDIAASAVEEKVAEDKLDESKVKAKEKAAEIKENVAEKVDETVLSAKIELEAKQASDVKTDPKTKESATESSDLKVKESASEANADHEKAHIVLEDKETDSEGHTYFESFAPPVEFEERLPRPYGGAK